MLTPALEKLLPNNSKYDIWKLKTFLIWTYQLTSPLWPLSKHVAPLSELRNHQFWNKFWNLNIFSPNNLIQHWYRTVLRTSLQNINRKSTNWLGNVCVWRVFLHLTLKQPWPWPGNTIIMLWCGSLVVDLLFCYIFSAWKRGPTANKSSSTRANTYSNIYSEVCVWRLFFFNLRH
jgi:hypothetical protein